MYEPAEDTYLFEDNLRLEGGENVLDIGTGCGLLAIVAAKRAERVIAVDINPFATHCALRNASINGVSEKMNFIQADLFAGLAEQERFDLILFNAPYLPTETEENDSWVSRAWAGGPTGRQTIDRFINAAPKYLAKRGRLLLMQSSIAGIGQTLLELTRGGLTPRIVDQLNLPFFETLSLIEGKHSS